MAATSTIARVIRYTGSVQGVGFRYTARSLARHYPVGGWVRNLPDGRVEMVIEGPQAEVDACLKDIRDYWGSMIADEAIEECDVTGLVSFEIQR